MSTVLSVRDLRVSFGDVAAVNGVSFDLPAGGTLGVVGESGSGKSTLALALLGLHDPALTTVSGAVSFEGRDVTGNTTALRGGEIAMIFQDPLSALDPYRTVGAQITEVYRTHLGGTRRAAATRAVELLDRVGIPDPRRRAGAYPHQLSGGMRQRALIAMAVSCDPKVLVADEPTTALDVTVQAQILDLLADLRRERGLALLLVTHNLAVVAENTDRVLVMRDGLAVETGPTRRVLSAPTADYTKALLAAIPRVPTDSPEPVGGEPLLTVTDVKRYFPGPRRAPWKRREHLTAVDGVSLDIRRGETLGIIGESGCGKSTLARLLVGLTAPTGGTVAHDGPRRDVQMVFQDPLASLNPRQRIGAILRAPYEIHPDLPPQTPEELLKLVGLEAAHADRYPHQLSGGQRQRVGIARALAVHPKILVADEPFAALDVSTQANIVTLLADVRAERGLTLVVVSHDLAVIGQIADRVAVMYLGRIVELADRATLFSAPRHPYTKALLAAAPTLGQEPAERTLLPGDPPSPYRLPTGCRFRSRCPIAREECAVSEPELVETAPGTFTACHFA